MKKIALLLFAVFFAATAFSQDVIELDLKVKIPVSAMLAAGVLVEGDEMTTIAASALLSLDRVLKGSDLTGEQQKALLEAVKSFSVTASKEYSDGTKEVKTIGSKPMN